MIKDVMNKVPWKKVLKIGGYVVAGAVAIGQSMDKDREKEEKEALLERVSNLEKLNSENK